jgi:hypothetical protein
LLATALLLLIAGTVRHIACLPLWPGRAGIPIAIITRTIITRPVAVIVVSVVIYFDYIAVSSIITACYIGQPVCIGAVIISTPATYTVIRVSITVSTGIYNPSRARIIYPPNLRTINIKGIIVYIDPARAANVINVIYLYPAAGDPLYITYTRTCNIAAVIAGVKVIQHHCPTKKRSYTRSGYIIVINYRAVYVELWRKGPVIVRDIIIAIRCIYINIRAQWRPAVIFIIAAPVNPGWSPFIIGYPFPAIIIIKAPAAVMERCPTPVII